MNNENKNMKLTQMLLLLELLLLLLHVFKPFQKQWLNRFLPWFKHGEQKKQSFQQQHLCYFHFLIKVSYS